MSYTRDGVNPLRPYYKPPTIGEPTSSLPKTTPDPKPFAHGANVTGSAKYASKAREVFTDLEYNDYLGDASPSVAQSVKDFVDELIWRYTSALMAQPFEVAKTILQVRDQDEKALLAEADPWKRKTSQTLSIYDKTYDDDDSDGDEPAYFTSNVPSTPTPIHSRGHSLRRAGSDSPMPSPRSPKKPTIPEHFIVLRRPDSVLDVISQLWNKEGAWGVWKGSNATFLYTLLQSLLENWSRSFLSAIMNVPDLGVKDDLDRLIDIASPYPWTSFFVAGAAAIASGVLLAPLDLVRTRLIVSPSSKGQRRTLASLRALPSYVCHPTLFVPTMLHSLVHPVLSLSTPLVLRTQFMVDNQVSPMTFSVAKFFASSAAVFVKLPLETVLRRGQMAVLSGQDYVKALGGKELSTETVVPVGRYNGVFGTMYQITSQEGEREMAAKPKKFKVKTKSAMPVYKKGQGLPGLWRGWKVNWWGLVGLWAVGVVGNGGEGEF